MKEKIIPIMSVVIGVFAFALTHYYLEAQQAKIEKEWESLRRARKKVSVMIAARTIPKGTRIGENDIAKVEKYEATVPPEAVMHQEALAAIGKKTLYRMEKGDVLKWSFIEGGQRRTSLAQAVKPGMRALSLAIGGASTVSGMVRPEDRVDILGTFNFPSKTVEEQMETVTLTILQDVTVLATGQRKANEIVLNRDRMRDSSYSTVTVQVTPREAELLVFAEQMRGRLTLTLRNPADVSFEKDLPEVNFQRLEEKLPELNLHRQKHIRHKTNL
ncbi:MAG: Flp pilus assembly protein CpaB [Verrucomicrobiota bacterium]